MLPMIKMKITLPFTLFLVLLLSVPGLPGTEEDQESSAATEMVLLGGPRFHAVNWDLHLQEIKFDKAIIEDFNTAQLGWILDDMVIAKHPKFCFLQTGLLDALLGVPAEKVASAVRDDAAKLRAHGIQLVIVADVPLPIAQPRFNERIASINDKLESVARELHLPFLNVNQTLAPGGYLMTSYSKSGLGLDEQATSILGQAVRGLYDQLSGLTPEPEPNRELHATRVVKEDPLERFRLSNKRVNRIMSESKSDDWMAMLGDSITEGGGDWSERLEIEGIRNCGQGGYTTGQLLWYLKPVVLDSNIHTCFIMAGINDISTGVPPEQIFKNYVEIIDQLQLSGIRPIVQGALLQEDDPMVNAVIRELNTRLRNHCESIEVDFLDLNAAICGITGLPSPFSKDGTHLTEAGYDAWCEVLSNYIQNNGITR